MGGAGVLSFPGDPSLIKTFSFKAVVFTGKDLLKCHQARTDPVATVTAREWYFVFYEFQKGGGQGNRLLNGSRGSTASDTQPALII